METKVCSRCQIEKPLVEFYRYRGDGHQAYCKPCKLEQSKIYSSESGYFREYWKEYEQRPEVKKRRLEQKKQYRKDPKVRIKNLARWYTNHQIRGGKLNREPCALCNTEQGDAHHLDYNQPLLIVWLCSDCHRQIHLKKQIGGE